MVGSVGNGVYVKHKTGMCATCIRMFGNVQGIMRRWEYNEREYRGVALEKLGGGNVVGRAGSGAGVSMLCAQAKQTTTA